MKVETVKNWKELPSIPALQIYRPHFREMTAEQAASEAKIEQEYGPFGYVRAIFVQTLGALFLFRN